MTVTIADRFSVCRSIWTTGELPLVSVQLPDLDTNPSVDVLPLSSTPARYSSVNHIASRRLSDVQYLPGSQVVGIIIVSSSSTVLLLVLILT